MTPAPHFSSCGVATQRLRAAFHFCIASCPSFPSTSLRDPIISIHQPPNATSWHLSLVFPLNSAPPPHYTKNLRNSGSCSQRFPASLLPRDLQVSNLATNSSAALLYELLVRCFQRVQQQRTAAPHHRSIRCPPPSADSCWGTKPMKPSRFKQQNQEPSARKQDSGRSLDNPRIPTFHPLNLKPHFNPMDLYANIVWWAEKLPRRHRASRAELSTLRDPCRPHYNCRDRGPQDAPQELGSEASQLSALSSGQWTPLRPVDTKRPMVESWVDDMDAVDDV